MHRLLENQLAKSVGPGGADLDALCTLVSEAYTQFETARTRTDRATRLMIEELEEFNKRHVATLVDRARQSELFAAAINNMVHGLSVFDADNRLVLANPQYLEMYRLPPEIAVVGASLLDLVTYAISAGTLPDPRVLLATEEAIREIRAAKSLERTWRLSDGTIITFSVSRLESGGWVAVHRDVTETYLAQSRIAESEQRFRDFTNIASDWCWETNQDGTLISMSESFVASTGIELTRVMGRTPSTAGFHPQDLAALQLRFSPDNSGEHRPFRDHIARIQVGNESYRWIRMSANPRLNRKGAFIGFRGTGTDITLEQERKLELRGAQSLLEDRSKQLHEAQLIAKIADWSYRLGGATAWWSPAAFELLRYDPSSFKTTHAAVMNMYVGAGAKAVVESQSAALKSLEIQSVDVKIRRGDGTVGDFVVTSKPWLDVDGEELGLTGTVQDISERKHAEERLRELAYYDPLTKLPNRVLFHDQLEETLRGSGRILSKCALLLLDLDRFKEVNDLLGHAAGDELLVKIAALLQDAVGPKHVLARLGGDEFAVIIPRFGGTSELRRLAAQILVTVSGSIALERSEVAVGASIGIAVAPADGANVGELLRNADLALYLAKENGRNRYEFFKPELGVALRNKTTLANDLRRALKEHSGLSLHYQPQVDLRTGRVLGFEALARWTHAERGFIPPSEFIPVAEGSSLICELGSWVLREAATTARQWLDAGEPPRKIAVNISAAQIWHSDLVQEVKAVLRETSLPPSLLCLELTESLLADKEEGRVRRVLEELADLGLSLALDDFGTNYSSLGYLAQLPFDILKIDRVFVDGATETKRSKELLKGIVGLGRGLGMTIVGEGAETIGEANLLREFGCDLVQGYVYARPTEAARAVEFARTRELSETEALQA